MSSDLQTHGPLIARRVTENPCLQPAALSCRGHHATTFTCCGLVSSKETSEKFLSVGRERKERGSVPSMWPWVTAQLLGCVAQAVLLGTGLITPGITAGDGSPSPRPITQCRQQNPLHPRWHSGALSLEGIKDLSWASLVAQWLRTCLLMQETQVRALAWEDPTCRGAAGPVSHSC